MCTYTVLYSTSLLLSVQYIYSVYCPLCIRIKAEETETADETEFIYIPKIVVFQSIHTSYLPQFCISLFVIYKHPLPPLMSIPVAESIQEILNQVRCHDFSRICSWSTMLLECMSAGASRWWLNMKCVIRSPYEVILCQGAFKRYPVKFLATISTTEQLFTSGPLFCFFSCTHTRTNMQCMQVIRYRFLPMLSQYYSTV